MIARTSTAAIVLVAALSMSACGTGAPTTDPETAVAATVIVRASGCGPRVELGTGTMIDDGLVVTAAHVIAGADEVALLHGGQVELAADVVLFDPDQDVAVLRVDEGVAIPSVSLRSEEASAGEAGVVAVPDDEGTIEAIGITVVRAATIKTSDIYGDTDVERDGFEIDAMIDSGDSGAMVHVPGGGIGIVWSRSNVSDGRAWAVALPSELLDSNGRQALIEPTDTGSCWR